MSTVGPRGRVLLATWISTVLTILLATLAIDRACSEAPYGFRAAIWGLLPAMLAAHMLVARYEGPGADGGATGGDP